MVIRYKMSALSESKARPVDRRVARTSRAIVEAFNELMFHDGVSKISATRIADRANIGRSTFYEHFSSCDAVLAESMGGLFQRLAHGCLTEGCEWELMQLCQHLWDGRKLAQAILTGRRGAAMTRVLQAKFEDALAGRQTGFAAENGGSKGKLLAAWLASATIGLLLNWMIGRVSADAESMALTLAHCATASTKQGSNRTCNRRVGGASA